MSVQQLEQQIMQLPEAERRVLARWFYEHENEILGEPADEIAPAIMEELLSRRREFDSATIRTHTIEETAARMQNAIDEVRRSRH